MWTCPPTVEGLGIFWTLDPGGISKHAAESGMKMKPDAAWRWLAQGGFTTDEAAQVAGWLEMARDRATSWFSREQL